MIYDIRYRMQRERLGRVRASSPWRKYGGCEVVCLGARESWRGESLVFVFVVTGSGSHGVELIFLGFVGCRSRLEIK